MTALIGALRVSLQADTASFEQGMARARGKVQSETAAMSKAFGGVQAAAAGFFAALTVGALAAAIKKSLDYAGSIAEVSRTLGLSTKDLQTFRYAAGQTGVAQDQLEVGLRRLNVSMGKAQLGSVAQAKAFGAIGISVDQLKGKNTGDVFRLMADGLSKVTDRSQRAAIEMVLMGRSGSTLDNLLAPGSKRLNELADAAQQLGIVLSDQQIQNAETTAHKLEAVKEVLGAEIAGVVAANASAILGLSSALATLTGDIIKFMGSNPQLALGIVGALLGGRVGGLPGAVLGGAAGAILGGKVGQASADSNSGLGFRTQQLNLARQRFEAAQGGTGNAALAGIQALFGGRGVATDVNSAKAELIHQMQLTRAAVAQARAPKGTTPQGVSLPKIFAGGGRGGRTRQVPADRSDELLAQMDKEIIQADQNILQAKQSLAGSAEDHLKIAIQLVEIEKNVKEKAIDEELDKAKREHAEHKITDAALRQAVIKTAILKAAAEEEARVKLQAIVEEQLARKEQAIFQQTDDRYKFAQDALHTADQLATTAEDHRRIQLEILDSEIRQKKLELQHELDLAKRNGATADEIKVIQDKLDNLSNERAQGAAVINRNTQGPLQAYFQGLPHTAAEVNQALQSIEVNGIEGLSNALAQVGKGWGAMRDAAISALQDIAQQLIQLGIQRMIFSLFGNMLGGMGGGGFGNLASDLAAPMSVTGLSAGVATSLPGGLPGFASGGSFNIGGMAGVDHNILSLNGLPIAKVSMGERLSIGNDNGSGSAPPFIFNNYAKMSAGEARTTGAQAAAGWSDQMARMRSKGLGG